MTSPATPKSRDPETLATQEIREALSKFDLPTIRRFQRNTKSADITHLPGDRGMPILGHVYWFQKELHAWLNREYAKHGPVFKVRAPLLDGVFLLGPEANELVLKNDNNRFSNFLAWDNTFRNLFDNNLLERDFANHKAQRRVLQLAFKRQAIEGHMKLMNPMLDQGVQQWGTHRPIRTMDHVKQLLLDTGAKVFLGLETGAEAEQLNKAFTAIVAATNDPFRRKELWFSPYAKGIKANKVLTNYVMKSIPERRKTPGRDLFSQFCHLRDEHGELFSDEDIRDHIIFILFAAHDTTTSAMCSVLYSLATNPTWQQELRAEMLSLNKDELEFEDIEKLEKTGWTFKEALRMHPALTIMPRYVLEEFEFQGHRIPANTIVIICALFTHYMSEYWSKPYEFDPLRFSPERAEDKKNFYQYIPFGGGAHKCLGMHFAEVQGKMFLFHLLKRYKVTKNPAMTRYNYNSVPLTFPTDGLPLHFENITA